MKRDLNGSFLWLRQRGVRWCSLQTHRARVPASADVGETALPNAARNPAPGVPLGLWPCGSHSVTSGATRSSRND